MPWIVFLGLRQEESGGLFGFKERDIAMVVSITAVMIVCALLVKPGKELIDANDHAAHRPNPEVQTDAD